MSLATDLGAWMSPELATRLGYSVLTTIAGTLTVQATATAIPKWANNVLVTTGAADTAVRLPSDAEMTMPYVVTNSSATAALIYPPTSGTLGIRAADVAVTLAQNQTAIFTRLGSTRWVAELTGGGGAQPAAGQTTSPRTIAIGGLVPAVSTDFTDTAPVITEVYYGEILVPCAMTVTGIAVFNGSNVTGNVKFGLYDSAGTLVAQTASTAGSGTDAYQLVPFTASYAAVGPATYFIAGSYSSATARYNAPPLGAFASGKSTAQTYGTLPLTMTPPTTNTANLSNIASLY